VRGSHRDLAANSRLMVIVHIRVLSWTAILERAGDCVF
jgi:hypothetical protein